MVVKNSLKVSTEDRLKKRKGLQEEAVFGLPDREGRLRLYTFRNPEGQGPIKSNGDPRDPDYGRAYMIKL